MLATQMKEHTKAMRSVLSAGLFTLTTTASAVTRPLALPPPSGFVDTESSLCAFPSGMDDETRKFELTLSAAACPTGCVQVAFGTDKNANENLEAEETDLVVGRDCNQWFVRNERLGTVTFLTDVAEDTHTFKASVARPGMPDAPAKSDGLFFSRAWNLAKVTTRGVLPSELKAKIRFANNPLVIIVR